MPIPNTRSSYPDCFELLQQALDAPHGIRIMMGRYDDYSATGAARQLRMRIHKARNLEREANKDIFTEDDPKWGSCDYDGLVVRIKQVDNKIWVYIEPLTVGSVVEQLGAAE